VAASQTGTHRNRQKNKPDKDKSGIYYVYWDPKTRPAKYRKFLVNDPKGILAIGKAANLEYRREQFFRALENGRARHSEGRFLNMLKRYGIVPDDIEKQLTWKFQECEEGALAVEEAFAIKAYVLKNGQPPPLNSTIPDRYDKNPFLKRAHWAAVARALRKRR